MTSYHNKSKNSYVKKDADANICMDTILTFLQLFLPKTTARKVVCVVLIAAGVSVSQIAKITGLSDRTVQTTGRAVRDGSIGDVLAHKKTSGRNRKTADVGEQILAELEHGDYHTRQQIADMIKEKFQITVSLPAVGRLLKKKRISKIKMWISPCKGRCDNSENLLYPLMERAKKGEVELLFLDASHFVMGCDFLS